MDIELHQLERPYGELRIASPARQRRLLASVAADGQQSPVLVVEGGTGRYVLIDGYQRIAALEALGRDTVSAIVLPLGEAEALVEWHRQQRATRRSALEDAWLLRVLTEQHGKSQQELTGRLGRTQSWISRRLGLLTALPETVQEFVRQGLLPSYSAAKYLVPMARAISSDCQKLAAALSGHPLTTRQMERLYVAWRSSDAEGRARLVDRPLVFLRAVEEMEREDPPHPDVALLKDVEVLGAICRRVRRRLSRRSPALALPEELTRLWPGTRGSMDALRGEMEEKLK